MVTPKKLGTIGLIVFVSGIMIGWFIFPVVFKSQIKKATKLKKGGERRPLWESIPFYFEFKVYIYNVSNAAEVEQGAKPRVQQVGPYVYESWKKKVNVIDIDADDTVEFNTLSEYKFRPDLSNGLTGEEELIIPHTLMLSIILTAVNDKPKLVGLVGLPVDCSNVKDVPGKGVCSILKEQAEAGVLQESGEMQFKFSLFGGRNATPSREKWVARRGIKNIEDVGMMVLYDNKTELTNWVEGSSCNSIDGTDGTIFAPFLDITKPLKAFSSDLCKIVQLNYEKPSKTIGIKTVRYTSDLGDIEKQPELECFCRSPDKCPKKGALDLSTCMGAPIIATLPHFYLADESYLNSVEGLSPSKEQHGIFIDYDKLTATPIEARTRMQFNVQIFPVEKVKLMANFPEAMLPLFWIEEGVVVPKFVSSQVKMAHAALKVVKILKWMMVIGGLAMAIAGFGMHYKQNSQSQKMNVKKIAT